MREIKYRAWDKVTKVMYDDAINNCKDSFDLVLKHPQIYEIMQYTGLKDKNGKEIYEGNILKNYDEEFGDIYSWVEFEDGSFIAKEKGCDSYMLLSDLITLEPQVIGNIYENPELLEE